MRTLLFKPSRLLLASMLVASAGVAGRALADDKQDCLAASEAGQDQKLHGSLRGAREQFLICARDVCPAIVKQDCTQWLTEIMAALPSVVVGARDWQGHDIIDVTVTIDGNVVATKLDGKPIGVDPGPHAFHYESASGAPPVDEQVLIKQGERNRALNVTFQPPPGAVPPPAPPPEPGPAPPPASTGKPLVAWVLGGAGVAALAAGGILWLTADGDVSSAKEAPPNGCAPNCPQDRVDGIRTKYVVSDVLFGVGVVSLGFGAYFFFAHGGDSAAPSANHSALRVDFGASPHGGQLEILGRF
jgi:hypothetical protein